MKRSSTACQNCKNIKRKCDGDQQQPCSNCTKLWIECHFDQSRDGRRRAVRKRNVEELELKRDALDTILEAFRHTDHAYVEHLLRLIQSNAPLSEIMLYAADNGQHLPDDQLGSLASDVNAALPRKEVLSVNALCDTPPIKVPAASWTRVTQDDDFVSHLISTYCVWVHPAYPCVIRDLFIRDMNFGDPQAKFCSPLLVNAMLGMACHFSDHPKTFQNPGNPASRGLHFLTEAMHLWIEDAGRPQLTTLQAGQILATALVLAGKDRLSASYIDQLNTMAEDVLFKAQRAELSSFLSMEMRKSLSLAVWSIYLSSVVNSLQFMRSRDHVVPGVARLVTDDLGFGNESDWSPYPDSDPVTRSHFGKFANMLYDLHEVGADVAGLLFDVKKLQREGKNALRILDKRLEALSQDLPRLDEGITLNPHDMDLHLVYHWLRIVLFNFARKPDSPIMATASDTVNSNYARQQCLISVQALAQLFRRYLSEYRSRNITIWMPQTAITAAYILLDDLHKPDAQEMFHDMCLVITAVARRWFMMRGHARMLLITAELKGYVIPERTRHILSYIAVDSWQVNDHKHFDGSIYPNYALAKGEDPRMAGMGDLLEQWADIDLQSSFPKK